MSPAHGSVSPKAIAGYEHPAGAAGQSALMFVALWTTRLAQIVTVLVHSPERLACTSIHAQRLLIYRVHDQVHLLVLQLFLKQQSWFHYLPSVQLRQIHCQDRQIFVLAALHSLCVEAFPNNHQILIL